MLRILLLIIIACCCRPLTAQSVSVDSLRRLLTGTEKDQEIIVALNDSAFNYLKSDPKKGRDLASAAASLAEEINFRKGYSRALNVIGSSHWVTGDYEAALRYYQMSARESQAIDDSDGLSAAYHNMGEVYKKVGNYQMAITYLEQSLMFDQIAGADYSLTLFNIGEVYLFQKDYTKALSYFDKAMAQAEQVNDSRTQGYVFQNIGKIKLETGDYEGALAQFDLATRLWKDLQDYRNLIQVHQDYANTYIAIGKVDKAQQHIDEGIDIADKIGALDLQVINYDIESKAYKKSGEYKKSLEIREKHDLLVDSVYDLKKAEQISLLQTAFESEAREIENQRLKKDKKVKEAQIRSQQFLILGISIISILALIMAWTMLRQRNKIYQVNAALRSKSLEIEEKKQQIELQAKKLETLNQKLSDLNKTLENKIEERTDQLQKQNSRLAEFAFMNAHQLRAPIARIVGLINLIQKVEVPDNDKVILNYLEDCSRELDQISKSINRRLEEGSVFIDNQEN